MGAVLSFSFPLSPIFKNTFHPRPGGRADGGHGPDARGVRRRLHHPRRGRVRDAAGAFFFSFLRFRWRTRETTTRKKNLDPDLSFSLLSPTELATTNKTEQSGTGVSVEAVDPVFQTRMLDMLRQVGRPEMVRERERVEVFLFFEVKCLFCSFPLSFLSASRCFLAFCFRG